MGDHMMFITSEEDFIEQMIPHHQEAVDTALWILARSKQCRAQGFGPKYCGLSNN